MRVHSSLLTLFCLVILGAGAVVTVAQKKLADFELMEKDLKSQLVGALQYGGIPEFPNRKWLLAATPAARTAFVKEMMTWTKTYTESAAFKADYDSKREAAKPKPPKSKGTPEEQFAENQTQQHKNLEDFKARLAKMSPDMQSKMAATGQQMETSVQKWDTDAKFKATMVKMYAQLADAEQKGYQDRVAKFDQRFPADSKILIASRLRQFLDLSKDVAFDAELKPASRGRSKFADPQYERKADQWKLCYRAGKEPVEAARAFAAEWLEQLEK